MSRHKSALFWNVLVISIYFTCIKAEIFTAVVDLEPLLETHKRIIDDLDDYIEKEEARLALLKGQLQIYRSEHEKAMQDIPNYLGNPINCFTLIKRLTIDLDYIEDSIKIGTVYIKNITVTHKDAKYPTLEDLKGAANALTRLQGTYKLDVSDLAQGKLNKVSYSTPMRATDSYELGRVLYNQNDYKNALAWMKEALAKIKIEEGPHTMTELEILDYISYCYYLLKNPEEALVYTYKMLEVDPDHKRARGNIPHYEKAIEEIKAKEKRRGDTGEDDENAEDQTLDYIVAHKNYEALCRGEFELPPAITKDLKCFYLTKHHPFLRLAPLKVEQKYSQPDIFLFYNVISDAEIELVKAMAQPRFKRAVVHDPKTGQLVPANYRISKSGWLKDSEHPVVARISRRVTDMTGLSMVTAEELQVVNYGIGGHYEPHFDFARRTEKAFSPEIGNRIATVLFYMSDVAQGGATVFTQLGLAVFPIKNSAVVWHNLHPSGEGDLATRHAACPVLQGSKWVSNKWIHAAGQEFRRPCELEYQREDHLFIKQHAIPKANVSMLLTSR